MLQRSIIIAVTASCFVLVLSGRSRADDDKLKGERTVKPTPALEENQLRERPAPPEKKPESALDDELLKSLAPKAAPESEADRLERVISGMRNAQTRISNDDAGKTTQEIQAKVVKDLDQLIEEARKQIQNAQNNPQQNQKDKSGRLKSRVQRKNLKLAEMNSQNSRKPQEGDGQGAKRRNDGPSQDSSDLLDPKKAVQAEQARQQQMIKDVWGHLPPNVREELLNMYSEKYLPKYEDLVRRYYEALAEKNRKRSGGR